MRCKDRKRHQKLKRHFQKFSEYQKPCRRALFRVFFQALNQNQVKSYLRLVVSVGILALISSCRSKPTESRVDFNTQIKPIINKHCITCHGGVRRQANFSLLFRTDAFDSTESGKPAIIPGDPEHSELMRRITSTDPEERMPYKEDALKKEEIETLKEWIKQGALWGNHWAYVAPKEQAVPKPSGLLAGMLSLGEDWPKNEIDHFILQKLKEERIDHSAEADKPILIRRVYLDLIGIPPTSEQAKKFVEDESPDAYEKVVNELLASPHFGEKWASWWLDMARYSDTKGYERDVYRNIWRYRDWVINAFNEDKPFDQFTIEQLAGDLLPNPTDDQLIATGFHRNTMNNDEGGTEDEEFRVAALLDRVNTTFEVWQSTTFSCIQCHSHPYDPFRHDEYYKVAAFFNNTRDEDTEGEHPNLRIYTKEDQGKLERIKSWVARYEEAKVKEVTDFLRTLEPKIHPHDFDQFVNGELIDTKWLGIRDGGSARLRNVNLTDKTHLIINYSMSDPGGAFEIRRDNLKGELLATVRLDTIKNQRRAIDIPLKLTTGKKDLYLIFHNPMLKGDQSVCNIEWFAFRDDLPGKDDQQYTAIQNTFFDLLNTTVENTPIMIENNEDLFRKTFVFERGNWLVKGEEVTPEVPKALNALTSDLPKNRLGFAQWIVDKKNPLTARTVVNRFWEQFFGIGLVETLEDFGTQGAKPVNQPLLDWLALRLVNDHQWSMKKLMKDIVMSCTYRQDSKADPEVLEKDPSNRFFARGPRVRLSSEQVRDQALMVSGLLSKKMYGRSVMPYQPDGVWQSVWSDAKWETSKGEDQYRRALYTFTKRTSPYPSMMTFDGSSREICTVRRIRTNTPLQALVTLNDPVYVDAARALGQRMMKNHSNPQDQIRAGYEMALLHPITDRKLDALLGLYQEALAEYQQKNKVKVSLNKMESMKQTPQAAAMSVVASAILNLDEFITKE